MMTASKTDPLDSEDWVSLNDAARLIGESRQTVLVRAVKGEVVAKNIAGRTVVSRRSVEHFLAERDAQADGQT